MNRGSPATEDGRSQATPASMRPRFMNRGSRRCPRKTPARRHASMRPRFMNRGSRRDMADQGRQRESFNEAPIHESGKFNEFRKELETVFASMRPRFMNRGSDLDYGYAPGVFLASMRPRFMNRGSCARLWTPDRSPSGFNEAPIHESGKCQGACGRGGAGAASMRPRFMNRGSSARGGRRRLHVESLQ